MAKNRLYIVVILCRLCLNAAALAQDTDTLTGKPHNLAGIEVTSKRISDVASSAVQTQHLSSTQLNALGISNFSDAVRMMVGVNVRDYGGIGGLKTVSIHNLGAQHTGVSYDGITVGNSQAGQIDIGQFSPHNVRMISLSMGQSGDIMQTARNNSSAGVLYIQSERPHFDKSNQSFRFNLRGGSFGMINPSLRYWQKIDKQTTLSITANLIQADGTYPFILTNGVLKTHEKRYNSDVFSYNGEANIYHTFNDSSRIEAKVYYYNSNRALPGVVILYNNTSKERMWNENFFTQVSYYNTLSTIWRLRVHAKYNHSYDKYKDINAGYANGKQIDTDRQDEYYSSAVIGFKPVDNLYFALAQDVIFNKLRNNIDDRQNPLRFTSLTSLTAKYKLERLNISGNLLNTFAIEHVRIGNAPPNRLRLSPSLSLSYRLLRDHAMYVRLMYKNTFRVPTFNDLYYRRLGNNNLRPEKAREYSAGLTWSSGKFGIFNNILLTADAYYNNVTDKIVAFPSTYIWRMANFGKVDIKGVDLTLATNISLTNSINMDVSAGYTLQQAIDKTDKQTASYGVQLPYTPEHSGSAALIINSPYVNIGYSIIFSGATYSMVQHEPEYLVYSYSDHSISFSKDFKIKNLVIKLQGTVKNLLNKQYEIIKYYPMPRRNYEFSGNITF